MEFIDTHSHMFESEFDEDIDNAVERCKTQGVTKVVLPAIDSETHNRLMQCCCKYDIFYPAMGLHPTSVKDNWRDELDIVERYFSESAKDIVAVGEIGLDLHWSKEHIKEQIEALHSQIGLAIQYNKPVILHTRDAFDEMLEVIESYKGRGLRSVFHSYSGNVEVYQRLKKLDGTLFGICGVLTYKKSTLVDVVKSMDIEDIVLETDSPYLTPVPYRGKRNESSYIPYIADKIAEIKGISRERVAEVTTYNAEQFFKI